MLTHGGEEMKIEEIRKMMESSDMLCWTLLKKDFLSLLSRIEQLEKAVEKHKINTYRRLAHPMTDDDLELYKVLEEK